MIAFQFVSTDPHLELMPTGLDLENVDHYLRYYFIDTDKKATEVTKTVIPAIFCT